MNILVFLAGVSVGWAADRLYNSYVTKKIHRDKRKETFKAEEKNIIVKNTKKEKTNTEKSETKKESLEETHDDLSQLKGVGPKLAEALNASGIYNYEQLSETAINILLERLRKTGVKFNRPSISVIMELAKKAAEKK